MLKRRTAGERAAHVAGVLSGITLLELAIAREYPQLRTTIEFVAKREQGQVEGFNSPKRPRSKKARPAPAR